MASWATTKTGVSPSQTSWEYYIEGKKDWKSYQSLFLEKDAVLYANKTMAAGTAYKAGSPVQLQSNKYIIPSGQSKKPSTMYAKVRIKTKIGFVRIDKLAKPKKDTTAKENIALKDLDDAIKDRVTNKQVGICIIVKEGNKIVDVYDNCVGAVTIKGTPKSDFAIVDISRNEVCQISHKDAGGAKAYQQYGSTTLASGADIHYHPILQNAFRKFLDRQENIVKDRKRFKIRIPMTGGVKGGKQLINLSIYGPEYGSNISRENVSFIAQGTPSLEEYNNNDRKIQPKIKKFGTVYEMKFSEGISVNGSLDHFTSGGYEPYIIARYSSGRSFDIDGIKVMDVRVLIAPTVLAQTAEVIK